MADKPWWPSTIMPLPQGMEDYLAQSGMDDAGQAALRQHLQGVVKGNPLYGPDDPVEKALREKQSAPSGKEPPIGSELNGMVKEGPSMDVPGPASIKEIIEALKDTEADAIAHGGKPWKPGDDFGDETDEWIDSHLGEGSANKIHELLYKNKTMAPDKLESLPEMKKLWQNRKEDTERLANIKAQRDEMQRGEGPFASSASKWRKLPPLTDEQRAKLFATGQPKYPPTATPEQMLGYPWKK